MYLYKYGANAQIRQISCHMELTTHFPELSTPISAPRVVRNFSEKSTRKKALGAPKEQVGKKFREVHFFANRALPLGIAPVPMQ